MEQYLVFGILVLVLILFAWGHIRHDFVALIALFILVLSGIIQPQKAFSGFGHPAVITVAAVLVIGKALEYSGLIDLIGKWMLKLGKRLVVQITGLSLLVAVASAFMNNVGALAIIIPVAVTLARKGRHPPSLILMPIAFASLLGGMTTLIGTPPNIIIATFRADLTGEAFGMFDFTPVGAALAVLGVLFIALLGWRLLPERKPAGEGETIIDIDEYITEVKVTRESLLKGITRKELSALTDADIQLLGLVRNKKRIHAPGPDEVIKMGDILILEGDTEQIQAFINDTRSKMVGEKKFRKDAEGSKNILLREAVVMADSTIIGQSASALHMRSRYGINLLAVARKEQQIRRRLDHVIFRTGDVLLLQGREHMLEETIARIGCLPLAQRSLRLGYKRRIPLALGTFIASIITVATGWLPVQVAFGMAALAMILSGVLPAKKVYTSIDWPVIVLLAAMIPVGAALETSGGANSIASMILLAGTSFPPWAILTLVLILTMFLSDIINNAATVVLMAPIAISVASGLGVSPDPFLMAVAIGGSCAFLTPVGHQSNTLVMAPGGYRFTDYWRMGLPLELIITLAGIPLIMWFWPF